MSKLLILGVMFLLKNCLSKGNGVNAAMAFPICTCYSNSCTFLLTFSTACFKGRRQQSQNSRFSTNVTGQRLLVFCESPENPTAEHYCEQRSSVFAIIAMCCEMPDEALQLIMQSIGQ